MVITELEIKSYKSFGNNPQTIRLNSDRGELVLLVDGDRFLGDHPIAHTCVVGGDGRCSSIAAASIVAKWTRDSIIREMSREYDRWGLEKNKGYLTREHIELINRNGLSDQHRRTFCKRFK